MSAMTKYTDIEDLSDEQMGEVEASCRKHFNDDYHPYDVLDLLEREFPEIDRDTLQEIHDQVEMDVADEARDSKCIIEWSGGEGIWGPVGETLALKEHGNMYILIKYSEQSPAVPELKRFRKKEFDRLSKALRSKKLLQFLGYLVEDHCEEYGGMYVVNLDYILEEDADATFAKMGAKKEGHGHYEM